MNLRGIFLTSEDPDTTANFYIKVAGMNLDDSEGYWKLDQGNIQLAIHNSARFSNYTHPSNPQSNLTHLYFHIESRAEFLNHLHALGLNPFAIDDVVITVIDPDGRKVMFGTA